MTDLLKYTCTLFAAIFLSCSEDIMEMPAQEKEPTRTTHFRPAAYVPFADIYEEEVSTRVSPTTSELLSRLRYIIYNASGNIVQERILTPDEIETGFKVTLPTGVYRICMLGEGRIVNYVPPGTLSDNIYESAALGSVWVSANQNARKPVNRDYFFALSEFTAGAPGVNPITLKRATGALQIEVKEKPANISVKEVSVGFRQNGMQNNLHTDGTYSCSGQKLPTPSEPYAVLHSLRYLPQNNWYEGVYFPTEAGKTTCILTISYQKQDKIYIREIQVNDFLIEPNKRTRLPITIQ